MINNNTATRFKALILKVTNVLLVLNVIKPAPKNFNLF